MAREDKPLDGFGMFGLVKETDVDDAGISPRESFTSELSVLIRSTSQGWLSFTVTTSNIQCTETKRRHSTKRSVRENLASSPGILLRSLGVCVRWAEDSKRRVFLATSRVS